MKKIASIMLALVMMLTLLPVQVFAADTDVVTSGQCGENVSYVLTEDGTLTISGTGKMANYVVNPEPWYDNCHSIIAVVISDGVTSIGYSAFSGCDHLTNVTIPSSVTSIDVTALRHCANLTDVYYRDTAILWNAIAWRNCEYGEEYSYSDSYFNYANIHYAEPTGRIVKFGNCGADGDNLTWTLDDAGALTINGTGAMENHIGWDFDFVPWYNYRAAITSVTIEKGVTSIGYGAFYGCSNLTSVTIPDSMTSIGGSAFRGCDNLTNVTIPSSVTSIDVTAFRYCANLTDVYYRDTAILWNVIAWRDCENDEYGEGYSYNDIYINYANIHYAEPTGKTVASGVCGEAGSDIVWDMDDAGTLTISGTGDMMYCGWEWDAVYMPWYKYRSSITKLVINEGIASIGSYSFAGCSSLKDVTIPASMTRIERYAFNGCSHLTDVYYGSTAAIWRTISIRSGNQKLTKANIHYVEPTGKIVASGSCGVDGDNLTWAMNDMGVLTISGTGAMHTYDRDKWYAYRSAITSVNIEEGVTSICRKAFKDCKALTNVSIADGMTHLGKETFYGCTGLSDITLPDSVTDIGDYAFAYSGLSTLSGAEDLTNFGYKSFEGTTWLENLKAERTDGCVIWHNKLLNCNSSDSNIILPKTIDSIVYGAFEECTNVTSIAIPNSVTSIGAGAFYNCRSLTDISIPDSVTSIGNSAFKYCEGLSSVTIPDSVISIGRYAFDNCYNLANINLPAGISEISEGMFDNCGLTSIVIPAGITAINLSAFCDCNKLTEIDFKNDAPTFDVGCFRHVDAVAYYPCNASWDSHDLRSYGGTINWQPQHDYATEQVQSSCTESGGTRYTCTLCGDSYTRKTGSGTGHDYENTVVEPTCVKDGYTTHVCKTCGYTYRGEYTDAVGHKWDNGTVQTTATCTSVGVKLYTCQTCGEKRIEITTTLGHKAVTDKAVDATCTAAGKTEGSHCSVCNAVIEPQKIVPAKGHTYTETVEKAACEKVGYTMHTCTACDFSYISDIVQPTGHTEVTDAAVEATYSMTGKTEGAHCASCGKVLTKPATMAMKKLAKVKITSIENTAAGITLKWNKVTGADAYQVWRKVGSGDWKLIKTTTSTSLTNTKLTNGSKYQYKVCAVAKLDGTVVNTGADSAVKTMYFMTCPTLASGAKNMATCKIVVKWNKNTKATGYQIKYVKGTTVKTVKVKGAATLSKTLSSLAKGSTYKVSVRSYKTVSGTTYYSAYSAVKSVKVSK